MDSEEATRQLFCFWQFNGDNTDFCNQHCPYCYAGPEKQMIHKWNGRVDDWRQAWKRLNRDIYFVLSYGEAFGGEGFYDVMDIIGEEPRYEVSIVTNLSYPVDKLLEMKVAKDKRVYIHASWHPHGGGVWEDFTSNILKLQEADIKTLVLYLFWPPQVKEWLNYYKWFDEHNIRTYIRRYVGMYKGRRYPESYPLHIKKFFKALLQPKSYKFGFKLHSPYGYQCSAGKDMILVHYDGSVGLCADAAGTYFKYNIFNPNFKLNDKVMNCPTTLCGGDYGMMHLYDPELPDELPPDNPLWHDCFIAQTEKITGGGKEPMIHPKKREMERWLLAPNSYKALE